MAQENKVVSQIEKHLERVVNLIKKQERNERVWLTAYSVVYILNRLCTSPFEGVGVLEYLKRSLIVSLEKQLVDDISTLSQIQIS